MLFVIIGMDEVEHDIAKLSRLAFVFSISAKLSRLRFVLFAEAEG